MTSFQDSYNMRYITRVLLGLDQWGNTLLGGAPDETISARAGRMRGRPSVASRAFWTPLAAILDHIQSNHVEEAIEHEKGRLPAGPGLY